MNLPSSITSGLNKLSELPDDAFDLLECGFLISKILRPSVQLDTYRPQIDKLCQKLKDAYNQQTSLHPPLKAKVQALQIFMANEVGFFGDEEAFDDLDHMNLFNVLETKCGTALTLSLLYVHCMRQCGWATSALNFPGYSLIRVEEGSERVILDPFHGCIELDAYNLRQLIKVIGGAEVELQPDFYHSVSAKTLAIRHINAIKLHFLRCEQMDKALEIVIALTCLEPESAAFWREKGLLQSRLNQLPDAISSLKIAIKYTSDLDAIRHTQHIIDDLEKKLSD